MENRIEYLDILRGLCMVWIIWYHTEHPEFVNYPFFNTTLFFVSGVFFKTYSWSVFFRKKLNRMVIPLLFFYLLYYVFLLFINYIKYHHISTDIANTVWDLFRLYTGNDAFTVNYPLWFLCALLVLQFIVYGLTKCIKSTSLLIIISFMVSLGGYFYIQWIPTPFMIGRSLPYLIYFVIGYVFKVYWMDEKRLVSGRNIIVSINVVLLIISLFIQRRSVIPFIDVVSHYLELITVCVILIYICLYIQKFVLISKFFVYWGVNSLIAFGLHDMFLTVFRIILENSGFQMNIGTGVLCCIGTLTLLWPSTHFLQKYFPYCVGKKDIV